MYVIVMPQHGHIFFVERADAAKREIETSQELEHALKFDSVEEAKKYVAWVRSPYTIEPLELIELHQKF